MHEITAFFLPLRALGFGLFLSPLLSGTLKFNLIFLKLLNAQFVLVQLALHLREVCILHHLLLVHFIQLFAVLFLLRLDVGEAALQVVGLNPLLVEVRLDLLQLYLVVLLQIL
jgi:hypothetical protein